MKPLRLAPASLLLWFVSGCGGEDPVNPCSDLPTVLMDAVVADGPTDRPATPRDQPPGTDAGLTDVPRDGLDGTATVCSPLTVSPMSVRMATSAGAMLSARGGSGGGALFALARDAMTNGASVSVGGGIVSGAGPARFDIIATDVPCGQTARVSVEVVGPFDIQPTALRTTPGRSVRFAATGALGAVRWEILESPTRGDGRIDAMTGVFTTGAVSGTYRVKATDTGTARDLQATITVVAGDGFAPRIPVLLVPQGRTVPLEWRGGSGYVDAAITTGTAGGRVVTVAGRPAYSAEGARAGTVVITGTDRFTMERDTVRVVVGEEIASPPVARGAQNLIGDVTYGDLNADGFTDLIVGQGNRSARGNETGGVLVYNGRAVGGFAATPSTVIEGERDLDHFGTLVSALDVDRDGLTDLVVASPDQDLGRDGRGAVSVYLGSRAGLIQPPERTFAGEVAGDRFGTSFTVADLDGDMVNDLIVAAPNASNTFVPACRNAGRVYVYRGQRAARGLFETIPWQTLDVRDRLDDTDGPMQCRASADAGRALALWDADMDGRLDLVLGVSNPLAGAVAPTFLGAVVVYRGGARGVFETSPAWALHLADAQRPALAHFGFGLDVVAAADRTVLVVRSPTWAQNEMGMNTTQVGGIWVFRQGSLGARAATMGDVRVVRSSVASARFIGGDSDGTGRAAAVGDLNGDGRNEYVISGASDRTLNGVVHVFDAAALAGEGFLAPAVTLRGADQEYLGARISIGPVARGMSAPMAVWAAFRNTPGGVAGGAIHRVDPSGPMSVDARWMGHAVLDLPVLPFAQRAGAGVAAGPMRAVGVTDLVVGAPGEHSPAVAAMGMTAARPAGFRSRTGVVDVFRSGATTSSQTFWQDRANAQIGTAVAILDFNGDGRLDVAVGDPGQTAGGTDILTAAYANTATDPCFVRVGTTVQRASIGGRGVVRIYVQQPDGRFEERFDLIARETVPMGTTLRRGGFGSALSGGFDANGDGIDDLLVGHSGGGTTNGAEVVLGRAADAMGRIVVACNDPATAPSWATSEAGAVFGQSVAFVGDIDGDGCDDAVASISTSGRVGAAVQYGFDGSGTTTRCMRHATPFQILLVADDRSIAENLAGDPMRRLNDTIDLPGAATGLGSVVGGGGDVTGDAFADVLLRDSTLNFQSSTGPAVEVISGAYLNRVCPNHNCPDGLRENVFSDGDYNVVGVRPLSAPERLILPAGSATSQRFGAAICAADLDGDGHSELLVGSPDDSWGGPFAGALFAWHSGVTQTTLVADPWLVAVGDVSEPSQFGAVCGVWGFTTRDPSGSVAVGAPLSSHRGAQTGAAFRWHIDR